MDAPHSAPRPPEQRSLAGIVFTDVVGFSRHAARDEAGTYAAMNRDFALFARLCAERNGRVANTAGDSMLLVFGSALDAMECALAIQRELHVASPKGPTGMPPVDVIQHRIGVHIGDVILDGENVFGDGVNVASRIEAICRPGAVTYSRAVSEIVHGKIDSKGVYLGPRRAKNIGEPIPVWEIPPISEAARLAVEAMIPATPSRASEGATGRRAVALVALAGVLLAAGFAMMTFAGSRKPAMDPTASRPRKPILPATNAPEPMGNAPITSEPTNTPFNKGADTLVTKAEETRLRIEEMKARYDFDGIVAVLERSRDEPATGGLGEATLGPALEHWRLLASLRSWTDVEVRNLSQTTPLDLGDGSFIDVSTGAPMFRGDDGPGTPLNVWAFAPSRVLALMVALEARPEKSLPAPTGAFEEFAREYVLAMPSAPSY